MVVHFYTKQGCPLCDNAEDLLESYIDKFNLIIQKIDINKNKEAYNKYWDMIPVIEMPDGTIIFGSIEKEDIESVLR